MDQRDKTSWVALELSTLGENRVSEGTFQELLVRQLKDPEIEIFIPVVSYVRGGKRILFYIMEGYAFVRSGLPEVAYFALESSPYVQAVMSHQGGANGMRSLAVVSDNYILDLKAQMHEHIAQDLEKGTPVQISEGRFHDLEGELVGTYQDMAYVHIAFRSREMLITVPQIFLRPLNG